MAKWVVNSCKPESILNIPGHFLAPRLTTHCLVTGILTLEKHCYSQAGPLVCRIPAWIHIALHSQGVSGLDCTIMLCISCVVEIDR